MSMTGTAQGFRCDDCHQFLRRHFSVSAPTIAELAASHDCKPRPAIRVTPERTRKKAAFTAPHNNRTSTGRPVGRSFQNGHHDGPWSHHELVDRTLQCQGIKLDGNQCTFGPLTAKRVSEIWVEEVRPRLLPYIGVLCTIHAEKAMK